MNLLGVGSEVVKIIDLLQTGVAGNNHDTISEFLHDAKRFILRNRQIADDAPLQLYCSGLIFAPQMSIIRQENSWLGAAIAEGCGNLELRTTES
ncbi:hypothetical protein N7455_009166 [Penicillium solitum]|uniref:uncharacterized protein n=1 Tax=Penicillium solitum TaxID=60172 RepID=UPI0032C42BF0|nr:hypothetical protein N7455_009166 [Penicillium solitum]